MEALLALKAAIEDSGGLAKLTIAIEDESTFNLIKSQLAGIFIENNTVGEIEGLNGIKIWNQE